MATIAIVMEGGVIQSVVSDNPSLVPANIIIKVIDYDVEGRDSRLHVVPQDDGTLAEALVYEVAIEQTGISLDGIELVRRRNDD